MIEDTREEEDFYPPKYKECPDCDGDGFLIDFADDGRAYKCYRCRGTGQVKAY